MTSLRLMLGCGPMPIHPYHLQYIDDSWIFVDKFIKHPDILPADVRFLCFPTASVDSIYASHVLEHISHQEIDLTLLEWHRVLKPGGNLHINVPDFEWVCKYFLNLNGKYPLLKKSSFFRTIHSMWSVFYGTQYHEGDYHKSAFTRSTLTRCLKQNGFDVLSVRQIWDPHEVQVLVADARA